MDSDKILDSIGVKNYRSFDSEGIFLERLSKVNVIIGKNNTGKSNVLRFLKMLSGQLEEIYKFANLNYVDSHLHGLPVIIGFNFTHEELGFPIDVITDEFERTLTPLSDIVPDPFKVWFSTDKERITNEELPLSLKNLNGNAMSGFNSDNGYFSRDRLLSRIAERINDCFFKKLKPFKDTVFVPDLRVINPSISHDNGNSLINGKNIIQELHQMQHPDTGDDHKRDTFDKLESLVKNLLNSDELILEISHNKDAILVKMHGKRLPLESYGSGIYQIILLCGALIMSENKIVCIEEPETHLHPELQRKFLDFIEKETTNTYFITTHSNTFINYSSNISLYHLQHNGLASKLNKVENTILSSRILDDLGYKSSDILQCNGIIWVEGPSDRNYLLKWIALMNPALEEGLHFSIMFYGGKNLANVSLSIDQINNEELLTRLIPLLKINRNAAVIIDSDITSSRKEINETKKRIQAEVGEDSCWITQGKEIENYINANVIVKWLTEKHSYNNQMVNISESLFKDVVASADKTGKVNYDAKKTKYSNEIVKHFLLDDLEFKDLKTEVQRLIGLIKTWNHQQ